MPPALWKMHKPEQLLAKLSGTDAILNVGKDLVAEWASDMSGMWPPQVSDALQQSFESASPEALLVWPRDPPYRIGPRSMLSGSACR